MKSFIKHKRNESSQSNNSSVTIKSPTSSPSLNQSPTNGSMPPVHHPHSSATTTSSTPTQTGSPKKLLLPIKNLFHKRKSLNDLNDMNDFWNQTNSSSLEKKNISIQDNKPQLELLQPGFTPRSKSKSKSRSKSKPKSRSIASKRSVHSKNSLKSSKSISSSSFNDSSSSIDSNDSTFSFVKDMKGGRNTSIKYYKTKKQSSPAPGSVSSPIPPELLQDHGQDLDVDEDYDFENNGIDEYDTMEEDINYIDDFDNDINPTENLFQNKNSNINNNNLTVSTRYQNSFNNRDSDDVGNGHLSVEEDGSFYENSYEHSYDPSYVESYIDPDDGYVDDNDFEYLESGQPDNQSVLSLVSYHKIPFNNSYHLSIDGKSFKSSDEDLDLLENYLEVNNRSEDVESMPDTPQLQSFDNLELYDLSSPLINGVNFGGNSNHRFKNTGSSNFKPSNSRIKSLHYSIDEVDLLRKADGFQLSEAKNTPRSELIDISDPQVGNALDKSPGNKTLSSNNSDNPTDKLLNNDNSQLEIEKTLQVLEDSNSHKQTARCSSQLEIDKTLQSLQGLEESDSSKDTSFGSSSRNQDKLEIDAIHESTTPKINRESINEMMNLLDSLQINNETSQKNKRSSIENMMNFLKNIQQQPNQSNQHSSQPSKSIDSIQSAEKSREKNRDLESEKLDKETSLTSNTNSSLSISTGLDDSHQSAFVDEKLNVLEKDLIDEINQLPEDFDFDVNQDLMNQFNHLNDSIRKQNSFMRSNSFNKKPKKMVPLNPSFYSSHSKNKIHTPNKTVTYYKTSSNVDSTTPQADGGQGLNPSSYDNFIEEE